MSGRTSELLPLLTKEGVGRRLKTCAKTGACVFGPEVINWRPNKSKINDTINR